jgi:hypothetical protein
MAVVMVFCAPEPFITYVAGAIKTYLHMNQRFKDGKAMVE